jgi:hypothetical protein
MARRLNPAREFCREEVSSLPPVGAQTAVFRHPPQRAVPSRNALPENDPSCAAHNAKETEPPEGLRPWRAQGVSPVFRASLVQTGLRPPSTAFRVGDTPLLALAAPAGVGQGQGVFVGKHSTAIQKRRNHMSIHAAANESSNNQSSKLASRPAPGKSQTSKEVIAANVKLLIEQLEAGHSEAEVA